MLSTSKHALLRLAVVMTSVVAVAAVWSGAALAADGTLEVCKSSLNGMAGKTFQFSISGGSTISVKGGRCSGPMTVAAGNVTITEAPAGTDVAAVQVRPSSRLISSNLSAGQVVVSVPAGSTAANETRVTFVNQPAGGTKGDLKICKLSETPAFWGRQFSFTVNGGPAFSTEANPAFDDPAHWSCRLAGSYPVGSKVRVQELVPAGAEIAYIDSDPADRLVDFDTNAGTADILIGSGMTVVLYDNEAPAPEGQGWLEVCKDRAKLGYYDYDWDVQGPFEFLVTDAAGSEYELTVLAGQCSAPIQVAAGISRVEELHREGFDLVDVFTIPEDRLLASNLINRTADVEVPVSDNPNDETQVHFVNKAQRAQLKLCKALGPGSGALIGERFWFNVYPDPNNRKQLNSIIGPGNVSIVAAGSTQCVIVGDYTIGTVVSIDELNDNPHIRVTGEGDYEIKPGINTVTITNQALGKLEICKFIIDKFGDKVLSNPHQLFTFNISGVGTRKIRPGYCTEPILVIPGTYTVTETLSGMDGSADYELDSKAPGDGIKVTPSAAELSRNLLARSVTVSVPYAGESGQEVRVDFYNRIKRAQVKVCKNITSGSADAFHGKVWDYRLSVEHDGGFTVEGVGVGECRLFLNRYGLPLEIPILNADGTKRRVAVEEVTMRPPGLPPYNQRGPVPFGQYYVSDISVQGHRGAWRDNCQYAGTYSPTGEHCFLLGTNNDPNGAPPPFAADTHVLWHLGPNTNTVHFTNTAGNTAVSNNTP